MISPCDGSPNRLYNYSYIDLEGIEYGPFEGTKMSEWDLNDQLDNELIIFRIAATGESEEWRLKDLKGMSKAPFLEVDHSAYTIQEDVSKKYHPELYSTPPFMRLPDPRFALIKPQNARAKVFSLYQLIITVPEQLKNYPPYTNETVCCQLCRIDLTGPAMFTHLVTIQHLGKVSNCIFAENDIDFWINRVHSVIKQAPASALILPGFEPEANLNDTESVDAFINRTKGFVRKLSLAHVKKCSQIIDAVLDVTAATSYSSSKVNRLKQKLTGSFLSQVVENLMKNVDLASLNRNYGKLSKEHNKCTFCNVRFDSFYDACRHVGTNSHREKIKHLHYHEGLVATWVRLLVRTTSHKRRFET